MSRSQTPVSIPLQHGANAALRRAASPNPRSAQANTITGSYSRLTPEETAGQLSTSLRSGLTSAEASSRLLQYGTNELPHEAPEPMSLRFIKQFQEPLILLLLGSAALSFVMGNLDDAISITIAVTIVVTVGFVQEYRSEKSLEALKKLVPHAAHLVRGVVLGEAQRPKSSLPSEGKERQPLMNGVANAAQADIDQASTTVQATQLVPGDLVLFSTGDRIPADLRIIKALDLTIDESNLTGENEPVTKQMEALHRPGAHQTPGHYAPPSPSYASPATGTVGADVRLNEQTNIAFMGTLVRSGYGQGIVIATGANTEFGAISASLQEIESPRTPLQLTMDRLGQELSYMSFGVIALIVLIGVIQGMPWLEMFTIGVSLAVAAIPEGLPIIVTVTLALGVLRMARHGAIVRRLPSVETLGSVNVVCSDKTGTLTQNHMTVTKIWHEDASAPIEVSRDMSSSISDSAIKTIVRIGNVANNARLAQSGTHTPATASSAAILSSTGGAEPNAARSRWVGQPTDVAILDLVDAFGEDDVRNRLGERVAETPFRSERKWMGVVIENAASSQGHTSSPRTAYIKGALEQVLKRCDTYLTKDGREVVLDDSRRAAAQSAADQMAADGLRVLGFASGAVREASRSRPTSTQSRLSANTEKSPPQSDPEEAFNGLVFAGIVGMSDPPRKDVHRSVRRLIQGGVKVIMITGDAETTAVAIAQKLGMPINTRQGRSGVLQGEQLDRMTERDLASIIPQTTVFARTSPEHKMKIIRALQANGDVVAMTGDGVNDAPALKKADIGISMGLLGTDVAKEAADMILTDDDFSTILSAIEEGKGIFYNIQNFLTFQLSTSVAALSLVLLCTVLRLQNPLNAMQILWINILMDGPPAQSLGVEPVDPEIMSRRPRSRGARVLTTRLLQRVLTSASIIMLGTLIIYVREMSADKTVSARDTTMTFTCFVFFDMFNALTCRSVDKSVARGQLGLFSNRMFNLAVGGSLLGQMAVVYLSPLQRIFQTEALSLLDLVILAATASSVFWVDEARKFWRAKRKTFTGYSTRV